MSLSVVIASFNRPETLQRAIDSTLQQETVEDIIVVDDASPEGTMPKAEIGGKVRVERQRENRGCCAARNTGLNLYWMLWRDSGHGATRWPWRWAAAL